MVVNSWREQPLSRLELLVLSLTNGIAGIPSRVTHLNNEWQLTCPSSHELTPAIEGPTVAHLPRFLQVTGPLRYTTDD
jgi:hypothetical protein